MALQLTVLSSGPNKEALWSYLKKNVLASYLGFSIRKLDGLVCILVKKGLILKKNLVSCGKRQTHFHIPLSALKVLKERFLAATHKKGQRPTQKADENSTRFNKSPSCKICRLQPAKFATSIKVRITTKKTNNNTTEYLSRKQGSSLSVLHETCDINFSKRELAYLQGTVKKLIHRDGIKVSHPQELFAQIKYALLHCRHKLNLSFSHSVNRLCSIIRSGNWTTPYGFTKYDDTGKQIAQERKAVALAHEQRKVADKVQQSGLDELKERFGQNRAVMAQSIKHGDRATAPVQPLHTGRLDNAHAVAVNQPRQRQLRSRLEVIFDTISRYQKRMVSMAIGEQSIIINLIDRLHTEAQEIMTIVS